LSDEGNISQIIALNNTLTGERRKYLNNYLSNAPRWLLESFQVVQKPKNSIFIQETKPVDYVYFLIDGIVRAIEYRFFGIEYDYMWFYPVKVFGAMEILLNIPNYKTTLMTVTPCKLLIIPKSKYEKWLMNDINALRMEIESMGHYLLEQARKERVFLFLQGSDRVMYLFTQIYEQNENKEKCVLTITRKELSERSGLSIKTINRSINIMEENGYLSRTGHKIIITKKQYGQMKEYLLPILDQT
jgi:cAMP-binding proteins - catabolite gene activator and regulatory subunit of cAMP-dependent protein kinases